MAKISRKTLKFIQKNHSRFTDDELARTLNLSLADVTPILQQLQGTNSQSETSLKKGEEFLQKAIVVCMSLLLLLVPLLYLPIIQDFSNLPKAAFIHCMLLLMTLFWSLKAVYRGKIELSMHPVFIPLGAWLLWSGMSIFWSVDKFSGITLWGHWCVCALAAVVILPSYESPKTLDTIIFWSVIGAAIVGVIGILQYLFGMTLIPQVAVPGGTFSNKNMAAQYMVMLFPLALWQFFGERLRTRTIVSALCTVSILTFLVYTRTRAAWVAALISGVLLFAAARFLGGKNVYTACFAKHHVVIGIAAGVLVGTFALASPEWFRHDPVHSDIEDAQSEPRHDNKTYADTLLSVVQVGEGTARLRLIWWRNTVSMIKEHLFPGVGLENWYIHYPRYYRASELDPEFSLTSQPRYVHNDLLQMVAENSVLGLLLYLTIFGVAGWRAGVIFLASDDPTMQRRLVFVMMAMLAFLFNSLFSFPLRMAVPPLFFMVMIGIVAALESRTTQQRYHTLVLPMRTSAIFVVSGMLFALLIGVTWFNVRIMVADHHYLKGTSLARIQQWKAAQYEATLAKNVIPWRHQIWFELGKANNHLGFSDSAIAAFQRALRIHPNHINSQYNVGYLLIQKGKWTEAEQSVHKLLNIMPDFADAYYMHGLIYEKQSLWSQALAEYEQALTLAPEHARAHLQIGIVSLQQQDFPSARQHLERAAALEPELTQTHFYLGLAYSALELPEESRAAYEHELTLNPNSVGTLTNLGLVFAGQKDWKRAIPLYQKALTLQPEFGPAHINLALAYYMLQSYDLAWKHCRIAEKLGLPQADVLRRQLQQVAPMPE